MHINKWVFQQSVQTDSLSLAERVLVQRGYDDAVKRDKFLAPDIGDLYDPFLLLGMQKTVVRIEQALKNGQKITIYGDYDVDGMTATTIMCRLLNHLNADVDYYIPRRLDEGYGINDKALQAIAEAGSQLIISVDCGITAVKQAELAKKLGVDLIITDHHSAPDILPDAYAIINPQQADCTYPNNRLAGAGVALKIAQAFLATDSDLFKALLTLAAVGTIADIMPLKGENRIIAQFGLSNFWTSQNIGLQALATVAGLAGKTINAGHIGFMIGPRLNAVGRLDEAKKGTALLLSEDADFAKRAAEKFNQLNEQRRNSETEILKEAITKIESVAVHMASGTIVVWGKGWHHGVIGIVASRLVERYYRPCIVLAEDGDRLKGSARSIADYSIYNAIRGQANLLEKFGGHQQAAGLTLKKDNLMSFIDGLKQYNATHLTADLLFPRIKVDAAINAAQINHATIDSIEQIQPFGVGNARPTFALTGMMVEQARRIGRAANHLKLVGNAKGKLLDVIQFNYQPEYAVPQYHCRVDSVFNLALNRFNGVESIQLNQQDMRVYTPSDNHFSKTCYAVYVDALVKHALFYKNSCVVKHAELRENTILKKWLADDRPVVVSSYEALLEYAYACFDSNIDYREQIKIGKLKILPETIEMSDIVADVPLFSQLNSAMCYYHPLDHSHLLKSIGDIFFDRQLFSLLYKKIRHQSPIDMIELLVSSENILLDRLAIAFFEEAGFVTLQAGRLAMTDCKHNKYNFTGSRVQRGFENFKRGLYRVVNNNQSFMP